MAEVGGLPSPQRARAGAGTDVGPLGLCIGGPLTRGGLSSFQFARALLPTLRLRLTMSPARELGRSNYVLVGGLFAPVAAGRFERWAGRLSRCLSVGDFPPASKRRAAICPPRTDPQICACVRWPMSHLRPSPSIPNRDHECLRVPSPRGRPTLSPGAGHFAQARIGRAGPEDQPHRQRPGGGRA